MNIDNAIKKCEDSGAVFTVDHAGSELEISNASCLEKTQVDWLGKHKDEVINFLWKKQALLVETKKVFHDLDLPWTDEDFKSLSTPELECELEKALPLLQDEDLLKEVEETRQARLAGSDDGSSKGMIYGLADTIDTPLDELEGLVPAEFKARLEGLEVSPATVRNCLRLYLDGQEAMASKYLHNRVRGNST